MSETEAMFREIQDEGMSDIGTSVSFAMDGAEYTGVINNPDTLTQMLTGGYQGRSEIVVLATRDQFSAPPAQKGVVTISQPDVLKASQWNRKQVNPYGAAHYAITLLRQLNTT